MSNPLEARNIGEIIQSLRDKIQVLKTEIFALEPMDLGATDVALKIDQTKNENIQLMTEVRQLKTQLLELDREEAQLNQGLLTQLQAEILTFEEKLLGDKSTPSTPQGTHPPQKK